MSSFGQPPQNSLMGDGPDWEGMVISSGQQQIQPGDGFQNRFAPASVPPQRFGTAPSRSLTQDTLHQSGDTLDYMRQADGGIGSGGSGSGSGNNGMPTKNPGNYYLAPNVAMGRPNTERSPSIYGNITAELENGDPRSRSPIGRPAPFPTGGMTGGPRATATMDNNPTGAGLQINNGSGHGGPMNQMNNISSNVNNASGEDPNNINNNNNNGGLAGLNSENSDFVPSPYSSMLQQRQNEDQTLHRAQSFMQERGTRRQATRRPDPRPGIPVAPTSKPIEPNIPSARLSRRGTAYRKRVPDIASAEQIQNPQVLQQLQQQIQKGDDITILVVDCSSCGALLKTEKSALLIRCPVCTKVNPSVQCLPHRPNHSH